MGEPIYVRATTRYALRRHGVVPGSIWTLCGRRVRETIGAEFPSIESDPNHTLDCRRCIASVEKDRRIYTLLEETL